MPQPSDLRRVLVVQTAFLGDVMLTVPLIKAIRNAGAESIVAVTRPDTAVALRDVSELDEIVPLEKHGAQRGLHATWTAGRSLRAFGFTASIVVHRSMRSGLLAWASGAPVRVGFDPSAGRAFLTHTVEHHPAMMETMRNTSLLLPFHIELANCPTSPFLVPRSQQGNLSPTILVAPGSQWNTKRWPADRFRGLIDRCVAAGWNVVVAGSEREKDLCYEICATYGGRVVNIAGTGTWDDYLSHVRLASVVVANDTAAVHVANVMGTPVISLFGPTVPEFGFAPRGIFDRVMETHGLLCRPCNAHGGNYCPLGTHQCMEDISIDSVFRAVTDTMRHRHEHP